MRFVSVRELRGRSADIWRELTEEHELVITSNGKPIAILTSTDEANLERSIQAIRRARAANAVSDLQKRSVEAGRHKLSREEIDAEITETRRTRRQ